MGAWIEIHCYWINSMSENVAPFMGAWIEILEASSQKALNQRRTLYGCVD